MTPYEAWHGTKPRVEHLRNLAVNPTLTFPRTNDKSFTQKPESEYYWDMEREQKDIDCMIQSSRRFFTAVMSVSTDNKNKSK